MKVFYYIRRFWKISGVEKRLLFEAFFTLIRSTLIVTILPLKAYYFSFRSNPKFSEQNIKKQLVYQLTKKSIDRAMLLIPWKPSCLVKSLTYKYILGVLGLTGDIEIVVSKGSSERLIMHAYVTHENMPVYLYSKNNSAKILHLQEIR